MKKKAQIQQKLKEIKKNVLDTGKKIKRVAIRDVVNPCANWAKTLAPILITLGVLVAVWFIGNHYGKGLYFTGIIASIGGVFILWALTMVAYFWTRKIFAHSKYGVEAFFLATILLEGAIISMHYYFFVSEDANTVQVGVEAAFSSIYSAIGKMAFEGMDDIGGPIIKPLFYGWALYAGLSFLSIITAKANYEFFSLIRLCLWEGGRDVYVFSALTEETLQMAKSIEKDCIYKDGKRIWFKRKPRIVFAGPSLEPFDRKDDLCREVMANNYIYWSFVKGKKEKSIAECLHLNNNNFRKMKRRFVIFAFESKEHIPCEEENMELVFNDIEARIKKSDNLRIEYYILTKRNINYEAYDYKNRELMYEYYEKWVATDKDEEDAFKTYLLSSKADRKNDTKADKELEKLKKEYFSRIIINVWSEASAISKEAARVASDFIVDKIEGWEKYKLSSVNKSGEEKVRDYSQPDFNIWCLGFGPTAQAIAKQLYCQSTYVDKGGWASLVKIDAYDKNMKEIAGLFKKEHPMSLYAGEEKNVADQKNNIDALAYGGGNPNNELIQKEMMYPLYHFHEIDCRDSKFIEDFDKAIGRKAGEISRPDVFVIATGDDYNNIRVANAIIQDTVSEKIEENTRQIIFINIWDDKNNDLVLTCGGQWDEKHKHLTIKNRQNIILEVFLIGNNKDIYSAEIVDINKPSKYHYSYELVSGWIYKTHKKLDETFNNVIEQYNKENDNKITDEGKQTIIEIAKDIISKLKEGVHQGKELEKNKENEIISWLASVRRGFLGNEKLESNSVDLTDPLSTSKFAINALVNKLNDNRINKKGKSTEEKEGIYIYNTLDIWKKESNKQADLYHQVIKGIIGTIELDDKNNKTLRTYFRLSQMEHMRWSRAHIVGGWYYKDSETTRELLKQHKCIVPYQVLKDETYLYDTMNVLMAEKQETKQSK